MVGSRFCFLCQYFLHDIETRQILRPDKYNSVMKKIGAVVVYSLSFNLADLNWPEEQSTSIGYLWS